MKFAISSCPSCGGPPRRAEHTTLGHHELVGGEFVDTYEWGDDRSDSAECDESPCAEQSLVRVFAAACNVVDAAIGNVASLDQIGALLGELGAAVKEARTHDGRCIVLNCRRCHDTWHTRVLDDDDGP